jgi:hypothetical protein
LKRINGGEGLCLKKEKERKQKRERLKSELKEGKKERDKEIYPYRFSPYGNEGW